MMDDRASRPRRSISVGTEATRGWSPRATILGVLLGSVVAAAPGPAAGADGNVIFILDGSGSMYGRVDGQEKIVVAKQVMQNLVRDLPDDLEIGLEVYGHRKKGECNDIEMLVPMGPGRKQDVMKAVQGLQPKGETPLSGSLAAAGEAIKASEKESTVVLVSDGEESCGGDPCATIRSLREKGIRIRLHVVGFAVSGNEKNQLVCMADAGGGRYFEAKNSAELTQALAEIRTAVVEEPPPQPAPAPKVTAAAKTAGTEPANATPIEAGEIVKGRLADIGKGGKRHYWKAALAPGRYTLVFEVKRTDDANSNIEASIELLTPDGRKTSRASRINEIVRRYRSVVEIDPAGVPEIVLQVENGESIVDYWLALYPPGAEIPTPFFTAIPPVTPLQLGKAAQATLNPGDAQKGEAYYSIDLDAADYRLTFGLERTDKRKSNVQGEIDMFGPLGQEMGRRPCTINKIDLSADCAAKLSLAEPSKVLLRIRGRGVPYRSTLTVDPWPEE